MIYTRRFILSWLWRNESRIINNHHHNQHRLLWCHKSTSNSNYLSNHHNNASPIMGICCTGFDVKYYHKYCCHRTNQMSTVPEQYCFGPINNYQSLNLDGSTIFTIQKRFKKKKAGKHGKKNVPQKKEEEEDDEEEEEEDEQDSDADVGEEGNDGQQADSKTVNTTVSSCRLDVIGKTCFNIPRAKFEECFYENLVRVNGERVGKKSYDVREGDQIDLIRGFNINQREQLDVNRVDILKMDDKAASSGRFRISYKKTNRLTINNYERDPYDGTLISSAQ